MAPLIREPGPAPTGSGAANTAATGPVRPAPDVLEQVVRALALPGVGRARVARVAGRDPRAARGARSARGGGSRLEALARQVRSRLTESEARKAEGWARTALATIERRGLHVLTPDMEAYPDTFRHLPSPPYAVFGEGRLELLRTPLIAVVGTRSCTAHGLATTRRIAGGIAATGATIVSGLALGIDGAAHRAAGPARTIGILGCGVDVSYPPQHQALQRDIGRHGLLLSEQLPGAPAAGFHFPLRNRMIAALAAAVVVVEAPERSGALNTARQALEMGRPVFAVPGPLGAAVTAGSNALIRDGGVLVTSAREILDTLRLPLDPVDGGATPGEEAARAEAAREEAEAPAALFGVGLAIWRALGPGARHVDDLAADIGLDPHQSLASLLSLEVQGFARQLPGLRFVRS